MEFVDPFAEFSGLGVPEPDAVADLERTAAGQENRSLHLTGPFGLDEPQSLGPPRARQPRAPGLPRGDETAAENGGDSRGRPADHRKHEERGGFGRERTVRVEQVGGEEP